MRAAVQLLQIPLGAGLAQSCELRGQRGEEVADQLGHELAVADRLLEPREGSVECKRRRRVRVVARRLHVSALSPRSQFGGDCCTPDRRAQSHAGSLVSPGTYTSGRGDSWHAAGRGSGGCDRHLRWRLSLRPFLAAGTPAGAARPTADPSTDKLAQILARGTLILSTDPAYPPQSYRVKGREAARAHEVRGEPAHGNQMAGYDADTSKLVAQGLGVEPCFVTPTWSEQISGHWNDRWDIAFASIGITRERMTRLYYTQPYSAEAERFFVRRTLERHRPLQQLSGKRLGGCGGCFAQNYIQQNLDLPGQKVRFLVEHATFVGYDVERNGLADVARGQARRVPLRRRRRRQGDRRGPPAQSPSAADQYVAYLAGAVDRSSGLQRRRLHRQKVDTIVAAPARAGHAPARSR